MNIINYEVLLKYQLLSRSMAQLAPVASILWLVSYHMY